MCTYCEHYVPPDTFRATQFRDLAGLDFPFHFFFCSTLFLLFFSFFFLCHGNPPAMCVRVYLCVAGWLRFLHMLVCSLLLEVMPGIPSCRSMAGLFRRWSDGHMVVRSDVQMVGGRNERRIAGILRRCLCEAFLQAIFHWIYMPPARREFSPLFVLQLP